MENENNKDSIWNGMTNKYELSKTLRFELKPVGKTKEMMEVNQTFKKDIQLAENASKLKYFIDLLHRDFLKEALSKENLALSELDFLKFDEIVKQIFKEKNGKKEDKQKLEKDLENEAKKLRTMIIRLVDNKANEWKKIYNEKGIKLEESGLEILKNKCVLDILKDRFLENKDYQEKLYFIDKISGEKKNVFEVFKGFYTYLRQLTATNRVDNLYSTEDKENTVAYRAINQNLRFFCFNKYKYESNKEIYDGFIKEEDKKIFNLDFYKVIKIIY